MTNLLDDAWGIFHKHPNPLALDRQTTHPDNHGKPSANMRCPFHWMSLLYFNLASGQLVDSEDVGQKSQVTTVSTHAPTAAAPIDATPIITPIAATIVSITATVVPIAAAVASITAAVALNATMLQHPQQQWQLPLRFCNNSLVCTGTSHMPDDGEYIDISNVSRNEEDNLPAPSIRAPSVPSPLQTVTSTFTLPKSIPWLQVSEECSLGALQMSITSSGKIQLLNARFAKSATLSRELQEVDSSHQLVKFIVADDQAS
ncbi:hypothetical protein BDR06DRAFT_974722 [Suillus hirtellus]|nr:hypothetical protein BDR06DRAFT_974722 [Suillus hirtellus]